MLFLFLLHLQREVICNIELLFQLFIGYCCLKLYLKNVNPIIYLYISINSNFNTFLS